MPRIIRSLLAVALVLLHGGFSSAPGKGYSEEASPPAASFGRIPGMPLDGDAWLGMSLPELETLLKARYADWSRSETTRALNNRRDVPLSLRAKEVYLQKIEVAKTDEEDGFRVEYSFTLTSPLSGSRVYSIVSTVASLRPPGSVDFKTWHGSGVTKYGRPHGGKLKKTSARLTYFFDDKDQLVMDGGDQCADIYPALVRLDEKKPHQVRAVVAMLDASPCRFARDDIVRLQDGWITKSTFYHIDLQLNAPDVLLRVRYGVRD